METRRLILALVISFGVFLVAQYAVSKLWPDQKTPPAANEPRPAGTLGDNGSGSPGPQSPGTSTQPDLFAWSESTFDEVIELGGGPDDDLKVELSPIGGSVSRIWLTTRKDGQLVNRAGPHREQANAPYELISPVVVGESSIGSYVTARIWIGRDEYRLDRLRWSPVDVSESSVTFGTTLERKSGEGPPRLKLYKSFTLVEGKPQLLLEIGAENVGQEPLQFQIAQDGPVGVRKENLQYDMRRLMAAVRTPDAVTVETAKHRGDYQKAMKQGTPIRLAPVEENELVWTALTNKFFAVFTRPLPEGQHPYPTYVESATGLVAVPSTDENLGDMIARIITTPIELAPGARSAHTFEIYAGAKDPDVLEKINPAYVDHTKLGYDLAQAADVRCCTFQPLPQVMSWLLRKIELVVRNYGLAIIILVIIVRTLLHPLTVFQQKSMFRMQEAMATLQPKMAALKEKFANDKVKLNQEMMRLYSEENVNPAGSMIGMLPLFLQMPILVALWTALNSDVHLRNEPFILWIRDLSAPDALYTFAGDGIQIPIISWFFGSIKTLNLLPILMGVSMWLQQKYMPKPATQAKMEAAKRQTTESKPAGMTPQDQLRQQQMIAYIMSILFPLMFYRMPSGLTLYWMATNVFGICETLIIRKQLREEKERREREGPKAVKPKQPGVMSKWLRRMAEQAEEMQRKADAISDRPASKPGKGPREDGRGPKKRK